MADATPDNKNNPTTSTWDKIAFVFAPAIPILLPILAAGVILTSDPALRSDFRHIVCHDFNLLCHKGPNIPSTGVKPLRK